MRYEIAFPVMLMMFEGDGRRVISHRDMGDPGANVGITKHMEHQKGI